MARTPHSAPAVLTWPERFAALGHLPPLGRLIWQTSPPLAVASLVLRLAGALQPVAVLWVSKLIIDRVVAALTTSRALPEGIWPLVGLEAGLVVAGDLLGRGSSLAESLLGDRFTQTISLRLMRHTEELDLAQLEDPAVYDKLERARRQTAGRLSLLGQAAGLGQSILVLLSVSAVILSFSGWFLVMLIVTLLPVFWSESRFAMLSYSLLYRWTPERRELDYLRMLGASAAPAKEIKIFSIGPFLRERSEKLFERYFTDNRRLAVRKAAVGALLQLLPTVGYYGAFALVLTRTAAGELSVGDLTFLVGAFVRSRGSLESVFTGLSNISEQALYVRDLFDFFDTKPAVERGGRQLPAPRPIRDGFEFDRVGFAYPGGRRPVLEEVSFRLEPKQKIALIGENGAGKTTLVKLLARLYEPTRGRILLDGVDLRDYSPEDLRRQIGVIFQDHIRFDMVARENIGLGEPSLLDELPRIQTSAVKSLADKVIEELPQQYDQMLGRRFEGGSDLSAGQWQKVALARAYMRDAQLVILDEPTASLDARAEFEVFHRFAALTEGRMAVLISHRFSTVRMADRILVLEAGRIREQGTHAELVALEGRYAELFALQAAGYR